MALTKATYGMISADTSTIDLNIDANTLYVDSSANRVGIGTNSPGGNLHIKSVGDVGDATLIVEADNDNNAENDNPRIELRQDGNKVAGYLYTEGTGGLSATGSLDNFTVLESKGTSNSQGIQFVTGGVAPGQSSPSAGSVKMTIQGNGNVGIGLTNPSHILDVTGDKDTWISKIYNSGSDANAQGLLVRSDATGSHNAMVLGVYAHNAYRMVVKSTGNVGIGTTAPASTLHVIGTNNAAGGITLGGPTETNGQQKVGRIKTAHYSTSEEPFTALLTNAQSTTNLINIGGASGAENAATDIKFFTAANNTTLTGTQRMIINSSGSVGIGTASPGTALQIGDGTGSPFITIDKSTTGTSGILLKNAGNNKVKLLSNASEEFELHVNNALAMYVKESGNVGIGTDVPASLLSVQGNGFGIRIDGTANTSRGILLRSTGTAEGQIQTDGNMHFIQEDTNRYMRFSTGNTERMRIDSAGNLLVGNTDTTPYDNSSGNAIALGDGLISSAQEGGNAAIFNRMTSNGSIINFRQAGSSVGMIGSEGGDALFIEGGTGSGSGLLMHPSNNFISPCRNGAKIDNAIDLGRISHRFRDVFVAGQVHLGGNTSNGLDDYEEGTWTPTFGGATLSTASGKYTKVGDMVTVYYHLVSSGGMPTSTSQVQIGGLPFTSHSSTLVAAPIYARYYTPNDSALTSIIQDGESVIRLMNINDQNFDYTTYGELEASHNNSVYIIGSATYKV